MALEKVLLTSGARNAPEDALEALLWAPPVLPAVTRRNQAEHLGHDHLLLDAFVVRARSIYRRLGPSLQTSRCRRTYKSCCYKPPVHVAG